MKNSLFFLLIMSSVLLPSLMLYEGLNKGRNTQQYTQGVLSKYTTPLFASSSIVESSLNDFYNSYTPPLQTLNTRIGHSINSLLGGNLGGITNFWGKSEQNAQYHSQSFGEAIRGMSIYDTIARLAAANGIDLLREGRSSEAEDTHTPVIGINGSTHVNEAKIRVAEERAEIQSDSRTDEALKKGAKLSAEELRDIQDAILGCSEGISAIINPVQRKAPHLLSSLLNSSLLGSLLGEDDPEVTELPRSSSSSKPQPPVEAQQGAASSSKQRVRSYCRTIATVFKVVIHEIAKLDSDLESEDQVNAMRGWDIIKAGVSERNGESEEGHKQTGRGNREGEHQDVGVTSEGNIKVMGGVQEEGDVGGTESSSVSLDSSSEPSDSSLSSSVISSSSTSSSELLKKALMNAKDTLLKTVYEEELAWYVSKEDSNSIVNTQKRAEEAASSAKIKSSLSLLREQIPSKTDEGGLLADTVSRTQPEGLKGSEASSLYRRDEANRLDLTEKVATTPEYIKASSMSAFNNSHPSFLTNTQLREKSLPLNLGDSKEKRTIAEDQSSNNSFSFSGLPTKSDPKASEEKSDAHTSLNQHIKDQQREQFNNLSASGGWKTPSQSSQYTQLINNLGLSGGWNIPPLQSNPNTNNFPYLTSNTPLYASNSNPENLNLLASTTYLSPNARTHTSSSDIILPTALLPSESSKSQVGAGISKGDYEKLRIVEEIIPSSRQRLKNFGEKLGSAFGGGQLDALLAGSFLEGFIDSLGGEKADESILWQPSLEKIVEEFIKEHTEGGVLKGFE